MFICVDLTIHPPRVSLEEAADTKRFHVSVQGSAAPAGESGALVYGALVYGALVDAAAGRLEGEHAWIAVDAVRRLAGDQVGPSWDSDLAAMIDYARSHDFYDAPGNTLRAQVEWS